MEQTLQSYRGFADSENNWPVVSLIKQEWPTTTLTTKVKIETEIEIELNKLDAQSSNKLLAQNVNKLSDKELIEKYIESREENVWKEFHNRFDSYIRTYINKAANTYKVSIREDFASLKEDFVQEVYLRLLQKDCQSLKAFNGNGKSFYCYLNKISLCVVIDYMREQQASKRKALLVSLDTKEQPQHKEVQTPMPRVNTGNNKNVMYCSTTELRCEITNLIEKTVGEKESRNTKKQIFLSYFEVGMTVKEIKTSFDTSLSIEGIESLIRRMKQKFLFLATGNYAKVAG